MYEDISKLWKSQGEIATAAFKEIGAIHGRLFEGLKDQQIDALELLHDTALKGGRLVADAKDYKGLLSALSPLITHYQQELLVLMSDARDLMTQWNTEVGSWFGKQVDASQKAWVPTRA